ncbi:S8 family serine peptidase [Rothia nasimurium]|nr:S8 family serine peptidase [Rothia nasimurium]
MKATGGPQIPRSMWHGTHVAGIAAAATDNGAGVAGVAPNARIQHSRIIGCQRPRLYF